MRIEHLAVQTHSLIKEIQVSEKLKNLNVENKKDQFILSKALEMSNLR